MSKRPFQIIDEMNQKDIENGTRLVSISASFISGNLVKQGAKIEMGVDAQGFHDIMNDKVIAMLVLVDRETFFKENQ